MLAVMMKTKWIEFTGQNQILEIIFIYKKLKNLLVLAKFYWSWVGRTGGLVLIGGP
jgi:hypothetical protein